VPGTLKETGLLRPGIGRFEFRRLTALPTAEAGDKNPLPLPLPLRRVIQRDSAVFSSDAGDAQSNENTEKVREVRVVAPTGYATLCSAAGARSCLQTGGLNIYLPSPMGQLNWSFAKRAGSRRRIAPRVPSLLP